MKPTPLSIFMAFACAAMIGCDSKDTDSPAPRPGMTSADITGAWKVDSISGTSHPMVGGVIELTEDGRMIGYMPSGEKEEGKTPMFWHLLRMESGDMIIALDSTFPTSSGSSPVLEEFNMPMAVVLEGDKMTWNLLTRDGMKRAAPSDKAAYKFTRKQGGK